MAYTTDKLELAWLAGWLEGEGCFGAYTSTRKRPDRPRAYTNTKFQIQAPSTDRDVVERAAVAMGGYVNYRAPRYPGCKPQWCACLTRRAEVLDLLSALRPMMGERRSAKFDEVLAQAAS